MVKISHTDVQRWVPEVLDERRFESARPHYKEGKLRLNGVGRNPTDVIIWVPEERKR